MDSHETRRRPAGKLPRYRAARAFYITLVLGIIFAAFAIRSHYFPSHQQQGYQAAASISGRSSDPLSHEPLLHIRDSDDICRRVNTIPVDDQCAFIRKHCPIDEGAFSLYLELYYCRFAHLKPVAFTILISWLGLLFSTIGIAASDFFCENLESISAILGLSENVAGVTFVAFGNGSPDVFSTFAAMGANSGSLAVGELFGAAGFITAVVAGSMALIQTFHMPRSDFLRDTGFFTVAAVFSLYFLWDGKLHLWECISMVVFYIFYVVVVLLMSSWKARKKARRAKEHAARGHFVSPDDDDDDDDSEFPETYHDEPSVRAVSRQVSWGVNSNEDFSALERGPGSAQLEEEDAEEARDRIIMSEMAHEMRLNRPTRRTRSSTATPIRPSLVGALEFQSVLKSLHRAQNHQTIALHSRRFSDDPTYALTDVDQLSTVSDPASRSQSSVRSNPDHFPRIPRGHAANLSVPDVGPSGRMRAVSANDAAGLQLDPDLRRFSRDEPQEGQPDDQASEDDFALASMSSLHDDPASLSGRQVPLTLNVQAATPREHASFSESPGAMTPRHDASFLRPVVQQARGQAMYNNIQQHRPAHRRTSSARQAHEVPIIVVPDEDGDANATFPFPSYRDSPTSSISGGPRSPMSSRAPSLHLASPLGPVDSPDCFSDQDGPCNEAEKPLRWWPYNLLPPPSVILRTLFPTVVRWHDRSFWGKCVGISAMPSVFLLTLTLPVVPLDDMMAKDDTPPLDESMHWSAKPPTRVKSQGPKTADHSVKGVPVASLVQVDESGSSDITAEHQESTSEPTHPIGANLTALDTALQHESPVARLPVPHYEAHEGPRVWNRWLLIIQLFLAPQFILLAIYLQAPTDLEPRWLLRSSLICLVVSLVLLIPLLLTTTPTHKPRMYHTILSNAGFIVSVAWISTVASQVVDSLKALAVICNMSHAIMGLTIFAVGNSLGDLVANVTLAQLGRPVMALSACFGGPLLNILLGIGLSGSYILISGAERRHEKHPDKHLRFKTFHIEVERTLIISGFTLLLTLVGLMIAVPLNKFQFGKRIGWCLIALWTISTIINVAIEVAGLNTSGHKHT
jgi:sodium/potassium/calcium exchanger 6